MPGWFAIGQVPGFVGITVMYPFHFFDGFYDVGIVVKEQKYLPIPLMHFFGYLNHWIKND